VKDDKILLVLRMREEQPFVTVPRAAKLLGVTYRTAQLHVDRLQQKGILKPRDARRHGKMYTASDVLRVLNTNTEDAEGHNWSPGANARQRILQSFLLLLRVLRRSRQDKRCRLP